MKFADLCVQFAVWSELEVPPIMIDCVWSRARYVENADWVGAGIAGCGISSDVPVRVVLGIAVRVVDVDVAVGGKGWVQGYA